MNYKDNSKEKSMVDFSNLIIMAGSGVAMSFIEKALKHLGKESWAEAVNTSGTLAISGYTLTLIIKLFNNLKFLA